MYFHVFADKPDRPQGPIRLDALLKNSVIISWKPPTDDGGCLVTNYIVEKREDKEGAAWQLVSSSINGTSCRVPSLIDRAGYFFRVYAQNRYGNSEPLELSSPILIKSQLGTEIFDEYYVKCLLRASSNPNMYIYRPRF